MVPYPTARIETIKLFFTNIVSLTGPKPNKLKCSIRIIPTSRQGQNIGRKRITGVSASPVRDETSIGKAVPYLTARIDTGKPFFYRYIVPNGTKNNETIFFTNIVSLTGPKPNKLKCTTRIKTLSRQGRNIGSKKKGMYYTTLSR